jgi:signal transduction histidine kinase
MGRINEIKTLRYIFLKYMLVFIILLFLNLLIVIGFSEINDSIGFYVTTYDTWKLLFYLILCMIEIIVLGNVFGRNMGKELKLLEQISDKIKSEDLDIEVRHSKITEIENVLISLNTMSHELKKSLRQLWLSEAVKNNNMAALAHDIKTPLSVIRGNSELLKETILSEEQREYIGSIEKSVIKIEQYIIILLDEIRTDKSLNINYERVNLKQFMSHIIENITSILSGKNISLKMECRTDDDTYFDRLQMERALDNIIMNSAEYTNQDGIIRIIADKDKTHTIFVIEDSGCGFTKEIIKHGTDQFFQGDKSRSGSHYGLGLYIVKSIIEQHKGTIRLDNSESLGGAKVIINIPIS